MEDGSRELFTHPCSLLDHPFAFFFVLVSLFCPVFFFFLAITGPATREIMDVEDLMGFGYKNK